MACQSVIIMKYRKMEKQLVYSQKSYSYIINSKKPHPNTHPSHQ